jgi:hypothetical protein
MKNCCQELPEITCEVVDINKRIFPLQFEDNTLIVNSPMKIENNLTIGGATISIGVGENINLPARTLINGVPLISQAFATDVIQLPSNTIFNGYIPTTEQFFYFFTASSSSSLTSSYNGYIINGRNFPTNGNPTVDLRGFPFIAPEDCVLTSFKMLYVLSPGSFGTPGNASISLIVMDSNMNTFFTGVSYAITEPSSNSRTFLESQFEYYVKKGDSVGVYVSGTSQAGGSGGVCPFATLGYRIIPPGLLTSLQKISRLKSLRTQPSSLYNRFPFNNLMNFRRKFPISFEEQLDIIQSNRTNSGVLYGRKLTTQDYESLEIKQDHVVFLLTNKKESGLYLDISGYFFNTLKLETQHGWAGLLIGNDEEKSYETERSASTYFSGNLSRLDYLELLEQHNMPKHIDYFSFDIENANAFDAFEKLLPILDHYTFGVVSIRHTENSNVQSITCKMFLHYNYMLIFHNVLTEQDSKWRVSETWYVHPDLLQPQIIQKIKEHPENTGKIPWSKCMKIINSIIN